MTEISELDLQNLRHLIGGFDTTHCKMQEYAQKAEDMEVKTVFSRNLRSPHSRQSSSLCSFYSRRWHR